MIIKIKLTLGGLRNPCIVNVSSTPETPINFEDLEKMKIIKTCLTIRY